MESPIKRLLASSTSGHYKIWIINSVALMSILGIFGFFQFKWAWEQELRFISTEMDSRAAWLDEYLGNAASVVGKGAF